MDFFKAQLERISRQLGGLSASQKMLTATLVVIMVMTLIWWGRYAAEPDMEPLFSRPIAAEEAAAVLQTLDQHHIRHSSNGDTLLVPAADQLKAYSLLAYNKALPRAGKDAYDDIIKNTNPFQSESMNDKMWNRARDKTLGQLIGEFPDVASANVIITTPQEVRIGRNSEPVATVTITTQSGKNNKDLVEAAASTVQGAENDLHRSNIRVVMNGHAMSVKDDSNDTAIEDLRAAAHDEEIKIEDRIRKHYDYMMGFIVTVTVAVNTQRVDQHKTAYDPKTSMSKEKEVHTSTDEATNPPTSQGEGGAVPNSSLTVNAPTPGGASAGGSNHDESDTKFENFAGVTDTHTQNAPGETTPIGAAVQVPIEYYARIYRLSHPEVTDLLNPELNKYVNGELLKVKEQVKKCAAFKDDAIAIETYIDPNPAPVAAPAPAGVLSASFIGANHIKEVVLGALALVSLFMVSTLVKKGSPTSSAPAPSTMVASGETEIINGVETPVGEVGTADQSLDGLELDPEAIRTQQVAQQVTSLVKENPDSAAALVKRWLNRA